MDECKRCPDCHFVPDMKIVDSYDMKSQNVELRCDQHGHVALGSTLTQAIRHWNIYVTFVEETRAAS